jgi:hypothetical protein
LRPYERVHSAPLARSPGQAHAAPSSEDKWVAITPEGFFDSSSDARRWYEALERTNAENVRASLDQTAGSRGTIRIRGASMTIGLARDWLAWHDQQKAVREARFRRWQFIASASVLLAAVGLALKAWLKW